MEVEFVINANYVDLSAFAEMQNYKLNEVDVSVRERETRPVHRVPLTRGERINYKRNAYKRRLAIKQERANR